MDFETTAQLANHKKKFCMGADGTEEAIEKRLEELKRVEHDLDYGVADNRGPGAGPTSQGILSPGQRTSNYNPATLRQSGAPGSGPLSYHSGNPGAGTGQPSAPSTKQPPAAQPQQFSAGPAAGYPGQEQPPLQPAPAQQVRPPPQQQYGAPPQHYGQGYPPAVQQAPAAGGGMDLYMADQIRRLEDTVLRQGDRIENDRAANQNTQMQLQGEVGRLRAGGGAQPYPPPMNPQSYPGQGGAMSSQMGGPDATDEALLRKLGELDGYLAQNPSRHYQANAGGPPSYSPGMMGMPPPAYPQQPVQPIIQFVQPQMPGFNVGADPAPQGNAARPSGARQDDPPVYAPQALPVDYGGQFNMMQNPSGNRMLDDMERAYKLRADVDRCDDLESEEKAMVNLAAQEYDALKVLSAIPEHTELYKFKLEQFKRVSDARAKAELLLQEQRLNRLNKNFDLQTQEVERRFRHDDWLEQQKRKLYQHKLVDLGEDFELIDRPVSEHRARQEAPRPTPILDSVNLGHPADSLTEVREEEHPRSMNIFFDAAHNAPRDIKDCELCFCMQRNGQVLSAPKPSLVKMASIHPDFDNPEHARINFNWSQYYKEIEAPANLVVEMRKYDPAVPNSLKSVAWTILQLYDPAGDLCTGKWRLPMYRCPTKLGIDIHRVPQEPHHSDMVLCVRIGDQADQKAKQFDAEAAVLSHYQLAHYHKEFQASQPLARKPTSAFQSAGQAVLDRQPTRPASRPEPRPEYAPAPVPRPQQQQAPSPLIQEEQKASASPFSSVPPSSRESAARPEPEPASAAAKSAVQRKPSFIPARTAPAPPKKDPSYVSTGIKLIVHFARQPERVDNLLVQATIYHGKAIVTLQDASMANWMSQQSEGAESILVDAGSVVDVRKEGLIIKKGDMAANQGPGAQGAGAKEHVYPFNELHTWREDFYELIWANGMQDRLLLLLQVLTREKKTGKLTSTGYAVHDLVHPDGKLRFGTFEAGLLLPPISFRQVDENPSARSAAALNFSVLGPEAERENTAQFIPNTEKQYTATEYWKDEEEDGVDLYLDSVRHFPESVTIVKVVAKVVDAELNDLLSPHVIFPKIAGSKYQNQVFNTKLEVRGIEMPPTALLHLTFVTVEATSLKERLVGFSYFPLFIDSASRMPFLAEQAKGDPAQAKRALHKGAYQMPIYCEYPPMTSTLTYKNFIHLERVPTASVLLRVDYAAIDYDGNFISVKDPDPKVREMAYEPPPAYEEQTYSTAYFLNSQLEREVFAVRKERRTDAALREVLTAVCQAEEAKCDTDQDLLAYFAKRLKDANDLALLDMNFFSAYVPRIGFRYNLEALVGAAPKNSLFQVLASVCPPGSPYLGDERSMFSAFPFSFCDWDSKQDHVMFVEDDIVLNGLEVYKSSALIIDINTFDIKTKNVAHYGFAVYPLAKDFQGRLNFLSGVMQLAVYKGRVPRELTDTLCQNLNVDPSALLQKLYKEGKIEYHGTAQAIVKAVDNQRHAHFLKPLSEIVPSNKFLTAEERQRYTYKAAARSTAKPLSDMVPKPADQQKLQNEAIAKFREFMEYL